MESPTPEMHRHESSSDDQHHHGKSHHASTETRKSSGEVETEAVEQPNLIKKLFENLLNLAHEIYNGGMKVLVQFNFFEKCKLFLDFLSKNPFLTLSLCAILLILGVPLLVFITFAFVTSSVTFLGFAVFEGTVLAMGSVILGGILLVIFQIVIMVTVVVSIISFCLQKICNLKKDLFC